MASKGEGDRERPVAIGLHFCDQVIVDRDTGRNSLIGLFTGLVAEGFPSAAHRFTVFASLTNGHGTANLELVTIRLDTGDEIYRQGGTITFSDPLDVVNVRIRVRSLSFPVPGWYDFVLRVDGEPVALRRLRVVAATG